MSSKHLRMLAGMMLGGLLVYVVTLARDSPAPAIAEPSAPAARAPSVTPMAIAQLEAKVARLEAGMARSAGAQARPAAAAIPAGELRDRGAAELQRFFVHLDERLGREHPDPAWQPEAQIRAALAALAAARLRDVACVASFCRAEVTIDPDQQVKALKEFGRLQSEFADGTMMRYDPADPSQVSMYIQRPGFELDRELQEAQ